MEASSGEIEESTEDSAGHKRSKIKSLKTRLFGRSKKTAEQSSGNFSQSSSDITAGAGLGSEENLACSQGIMGSRALSHDSIFLADQDPTDPEATRVLSQENVHSKIKALQMKLQLQKMHFGPPPMVLPNKRPEDPDYCSQVEGDSSHVSYEGDVTSQGGVAKPSPRPLSPTPKPALTMFAPQFPSHPLPPTVVSAPSVIEPPLDFSCPAHVTSCLDTSAARHRMALKPKNQRASTKRRLGATDSGVPSQTQNNMDHPESVEEEEQPEEMRETEPEESPVAAPPPLSKPTEIAPEAAPKSSDAATPKPDQAPPAKKPSIPSQILRPKPQRPTDAVPTVRPHSSFIESELKSEKQEDSEIQSLSQDQRSSVKSATEPMFATFGQVGALRSSAENLSGMKRPTPGSGSFHFSITTAKTRDVERPRSSSFKGVLVQAEARHGTKAAAEEKRLSDLKEKDELRDRVGLFAVGRLKQEVAPHKSPGIPWDRKESVRKAEPDAPVKEEVVESSQEEVEEAQEAQEEVQEKEGRTAFGVKLRATMKFRADPMTFHPAKPAAAASEDQGERPNWAEISESAVSKKMQTNISPVTSDAGDVRETDPSPPAKSTALHPAEVPPTSGEVDPVPSAPQEPQPAPRAPSSSEVSWMSLAMMKTRTLQQLFTSRFPRDFTGTQSAGAAGPQAQPPPPTQGPSQAASQTSSEVAMAAVVKQAQEQQKTSNIPKEARTNESQSSTESPSHPPAQAKPSWTTQSPLRSFAQTQEPQGGASLPQSSIVQRAGAQPAALTNRGAQSTSQFKPPSTSVTTSPAPLVSTQEKEESIERPSPLGRRALWGGSVGERAAATPPAPTHGKGEKDGDAKEREGRSPLVRRTVWGGSVSERAAFLEKRTEWTSSTGAKELEVKKLAAEAEVSDESPVTKTTTTTAAATTTTTSQSVEAKSEGRPGVKPTESSPTQIPEKPGEEKWLRKTPASSSPSQSPVLHSSSLSDSGQPSWMELAKRKSMAWSDKTMD